MIKNLDPKQDIYSFASLKLCLLYCIAGTFMCSK